jgi:hypothetical protein
VALGAAILTELQGICAELTAAGVPASVNVGEVQVPGAWVAATQLIPGRTLAGGATLVVQVYLVVPDTSDETEALSDLGGLLDAALPVVPVDYTSDHGDAIFTNTTLAVGEAIVPAFRLTTERLI